VKHPVDHIGSVVVGCRVKFGRVRVQWFWWVWVASGICRVQVWQKQWLQGWVGVEVVWDSLQCYGIWLGNCWH